MARRKYRRKRVSYRLHGITKRHMIWVKGHWRGLPKKRW